MRGAMTGADVPFTGLSTDNKGRRLRKVCRELASTKDEEYMELINEEEVDELHHSWLNVSVIIFVFFRLVCLSNFFSYLCRCLFE